MREYSNSEIAALINEHIHSEKYRKILTYRLVDGLTYQEIANRLEQERIYYSVRNIGYILAKEIPKISKYIK